MASVQKIDHVAALDDWLENPHEFGHLLGYTKLTPVHSEWIKIFLRNKDFDVLQAHRGSFKTTCGIVAMVLLFFCFPNMRLLIMRKKTELASAVLKTIQKHFEDNEIIKLYMYSRWGITSAKTKVWSSEKTTFAFKKSITPDPSITAIGVGTSATGSHFDYIWPDDISTLEDRYSTAERKWTIICFNETVNLIDPLGRIRLSGTPWHEDDVFSTLDEELYIDRKYPIGTVDLPEEELKKIYERKERIPYAEWCCNYELRHVLDTETIGAFKTVDKWNCQYSVAWIDPSFSDKKDTDSTTVAVVGAWNGLLIFTGMKFPKSIADIPTRIAILDFLQKYTPIETIIESQIAESSIFFINAFKEYEDKYLIKNLWDYRRASHNKHERIAATVIANKPEMRILNGTQNEFSLGVSRYYKGAEHDDCPDALAGAVNHLATSEIVAEYVEALKIMKKV